MSSDDYVESMMADVRRMFDTVAGAQDQLRDLTVTAHSADRLVTVTVGAQGKLLDLTLDPRIYRDPNSTALATTIKDLILRAQAEMERKIGEVSSNVLPEAEQFGSSVGLDINELFEKFQPKPAKEGEDDG